MNLEQLRDVFYRLNIVTGNVNSENIHICCPFSKWTHLKGLDSRPSCTVKISEDGPSLFKCWTCEKSGTLYWMLRELRGYGVFIPDDMLNYVKKEEEQSVFNVFNGVDMFSAGVAIEEEKKKLKTWSEDELKLFEGKLHKYVLMRGVSKETAKVWEIGYDQDEERVVFPVRDYYGGLVGIVGRTVHEKVRPKYRNYWNFQKTNYLYGEFLPLEEGRDDLPGYDGIVLVEGMFDALRIFEYGYDNVRALFGCNISQKQLEKLFDLDKQVYVMFDGDSAGDSGRKRLRKMIKKYNYSQSRFVDVNLPKECDPGGLTKEEIVSLLYDAEKIF